MKTLFKNCLGLSLIAASVTAQAQVPPPAGPGLKPNGQLINPGAGPAAPGAPLQTNSIFSRNPNFGRPRPTNAEGANVAFPAGANNPAAPNANVAGQVPGANRPAGPGGLNNLAAGAAGASTNFVATNIIARGSDEIPAKMMKFQEADLSQILELMAELTGRTILRSPQVPATTKITIQNQTPLTRQEGIDALTTILGLNQIALVDEGEKFLKAVPQASAGPEAIQFSTNSFTQLRESKQTVAQIVQLKNILPEEANAILTPFANLPNSILALKGSPILILRDYSENVKRMMEVLEKVDISIPTDIETVVIPIKYALAGEIASVLSGLGASTSSGISGGASSAGLGGGGFAGTGGFGTTGIGGGGFGNTGFGNTGFGNSGIGGLNRGGIGGSSFGGGLNRGFGGTGGGNAFGANRTGFGSRVNNAVQRATGGSPGAGGAPGDISLIGNAKIIPDERSNALLVFAEKRDLTTISNIIAKLDVVLPQVLIEALILEVNLGDGKSLGVSMRQNSQKVGDLDYAGGSVFGPGFLNPRTVQGFNGATNLPNGFNYFGKLNQDLDVAINAAASDSRLNVLSRPRIVTSTAKPASIFVGETRPYVTGTYFSDFSSAGSRSQYAQTQIGINLNVLPIINQEGLVVMDIQQHISQVGANVKIDNNDVPTTIDRDANAYVAVHDRDTIMLGGFISTTKSKSNSGVPYLKDIPGLGLLFRNSSENISRVELMVMIRPTVLPTPEVAAQATASELDRLPNIKKAQREEQEFQTKSAEKLRKEEEKAERNRR